MIYVWLLAMMQVTAGLQQPIPYSHKTHLAMGLKCANCHTNPDPGEVMGFPAESKCMSCHQHANVHKKQFADAECLRCHTAPGKSRFKRAAVEEFHGPGSKFPLTEGHAKVACERCHKNGRYSRSAGLTGRSSTASGTHAHEPMLMNPSGHCAGRLGGGPTRCGPAA